MLTTLRGLLGLGGMVFASIVGDSFGIIPILNLQGIGYLIAGCIAFLILKVKISPKVHIESDQQQGQTK